MEKKRAFVNLFLNETGGKRELAHDEDRKPLD